MSLLQVPTLGEGGEKKADLGGSESALDKMAGFVSDLTARNMALANALAPGDSKPTEIYFPPEMVAGCCPFVEGQVEDMAWQAAAESLDSERLHVVTTVHNDLVWFLAVRSGDLASHSHSWCPFAAVLPGMMNANAGPALYIYNEDGVSTLLTIASMDMNVHRGSDNIIQAKAERLSRDMGGAPIINLLSEQLDSLTPVSWQSASLLEDKARRFLSSASVLVGLAVAVIAFTIWLLASFASLTASHAVSGAQQDSEQAVQDLMRKAVELRTSPLRNQLARFSDLNDELIRIGGWLKQYTISGTRIEWTAVLPPGITSDIINKLGGRTQEVTADGIVVVGNN